MRNGNYFVSVSDAERCESQLDRGSAAIESYAVAGPNISCEVLLELADLGAQDKRRIMENTIKDFAKLISDLVMQRF
jgi:hypothetical protein